MKGRFLVMCFMAYTCHSAAAASAACGAVAQIVSRVGGCVDRVEFRMRDGSVIAYGGDGGQWQKPRYLDDDEYIKSVEQVYSKGFLGDTLLFRTSAGKLLPISGDQPSSNPVTKVLEAPDGKQIVGLYFDSSGLLQDIQTLDVFGYARSISLGGFETNWLNSDYIVQVPLINGHETFVSSSGRSFIYFCDSMWMISDMLPADTKECKGYAHSQTSGNLFDLTRSNKAWKEFDHNQGLWIIRYGAGIKGVAFSKDSRENSWTWIGICKWFVFVTCCLWCGCSFCSYLFQLSQTVQPMHARVLTPPRHGVVAPVRDMDREENSEVLSQSSDSSWVVLGGCFVKDTMLKMSDGGVKLVSAIQEGDAVLAAQNGNCLRVISACRLPRDMRDFVTIQTADSRVLITSDHRVALANGLVKRASDIVARDDSVVCGSRAQLVVNVHSFRMNSECVEIRFDVDLPVETFPVPSRGIWTYGNYTLFDEADHRTLDGFE